MLRCDVRLFPRLLNLALSLLTSLRRWSSFFISLPSLSCSFHLSSSLFISQSPLRCSPSLFVTSLRSLCASARVVAFFVASSLLVFLHLSAASLRFFHLFCFRFIPLRPLSSSLVLLASLPPGLLCLHQLSSSFLLPFLRLARPPPLK